MKDALRTDGSPDCRAWCNNLREIFKTNETEAMYNYNPCNNTYTNRRNPAYNDTDPPGERNPVYNERYQPKERSPVGWQSRKTREYDLRNLNKAITATAVAQIEKPVEKTKEDALAVTQSKEANPPENGSTHQARRI
jgi:hypothetical protein